MLDALQSVAANKSAQTRKSPEDLVVIIEDVVQLLDGVGNAYRGGRRPERKLTSNVARALRGLADELEK